MMTFKCRRCDRTYDDGDDRTYGHEPDPDWDAQEGRCYGCYLCFVYDIYGGWMEPCFTLNGQEWMAAGMVSAEPPAGDAPRPDPGDIPF